MLADALARARGWPRRTRIVAGLAAAGVAIAVVVAVAATRDDRVALFAGPLYPEQLAEVEQRLAAWNVPYLAQPDGVRVDAARRAPLLLRLSVAGVPHPHLAGSDETLSKLGALTPQTVLEAQTRDALAADLALALRGLDGVADARVVIAPASAGIYADEPRRDASAAVRISVVPGAHLAPATLAGIKAFVAGGVPGLDAGRVTVLDDRGLVADATRDGDDVESALQSALDAAFGAGATIVRVHREPIGERREIRDVRRAALPGALARTASDERYASAQKRYSRSAQTDEHGAETRDERRVADPEATARLSVAVLVDVARGIDPAKIRAIAAAAVGIRPERGDTVDVEAVPFGGAAPRRLAAPAPGWLLALASALPSTATGVAIVVAVAFAARPCAALVVRIVDAAAARGAAKEVAGLPPIRVRGALAGEPPHVAAAIISALPAATATAVLELYPPEERAAIVRRLMRGARAGLVPDIEELLRG